MARRAWLRIPPQPLERWWAFQKGLRRIGLTVIEPHRVCDLGPGDLLVTWNVTGRDAGQIAAAKAFGAKHIVAENGYLKSKAGQRYIALARDGHNGSGYWPVGSAERWGRLGWTVSPFRPGNSGLVLICTQRGIGAEAMAMPAYWPTETAQAVEKLGKAAHIRKPPSACWGQPKLEDEIEKAVAVVVWTSNAAMTAVLMGKPVILCGPHHILEGCLGRDLAEVQAPVYRNPMPSLHRMAAAQWTEDEIESGEPFRRLMEMT